MDREQNTRRPTDDAHERCPAAQLVAARQARAPRRAAGIPLIARRGFTLVELLVTIAIIAILAGIILVAAQAAQQAANRANTQALIAKLHGQMMVRYESYRTRRLPINTIGLNGQQAALHRLNAVRELMRMELPDRYSDLMTVSTGVLSYSPTIVAPYFTYDSSGPRWWAGPINGNLSLAPTAVNMSYQRKIASNGVAPTAQYEDAECLYLILDTGLTDDTVAGELINPENVGDADADGMSEFQDAWGRPIRFIRWAPGFISDFQPYDPVNSPNDPHFTVKSHDPYDPLKMQHPFHPGARTVNDLQNTPSVLNYADGKALTPLIYSMGQDGIDGIQRPPTDSSGFALSSTHWTCTFYNYLSAPTNTTVPFTTITQYTIYDPFNVMDAANTTFVGAPDPTDPDVGYADNITNHLLGQQ